nr:site-specific integrase [Croceicoccus sp. Ery15]
MLAYEIEKRFDAVRDQHVFDPSEIPQRQSRAGSIKREEQRLVPPQTFSDIANQYLDDPTSSRTAKSKAIYRTTYAAFASIFETDIPAASITREMCREALGVLQTLPSNASKRWPDLTLRELAAKARAEGIPAMSPANVNEYMNKLSTLFNWAVKEEKITRNPAKGLRIADLVARRDKRKPFSTVQLRRIFNAPIYRGCRDDGAGFACAGDAKPRRARFWIPLIALWSGMRQNEICQLHTADVRKVEGILCFVVGRGEAGDKHLKTVASERLVPLHPELIRMGLPQYVDERRRAGDTRLFPELSLDGYGHYSSRFSKWFARFLLSCNAADERTCFHSFRHSFRDALREAKVEREIVLAMGGWTSPLGSGGASVADTYGKGFSTQLLFDAIANVEYPALDLTHLRL